MSAGMTPEEVALSDRLREDGTPMFITDHLAQASSEFERRTRAAADQVTAGRGPVTDLSPAEAAEVLEILTSRIEVMRERKAEQARAWAEGPGMCIHFI